MDLTGDFKLGVFSSEKERTPPSPYQRLKLALALVAAVS